MRRGALPVAVAVAGLALAPASQAKSEPEAALKLLSVSGTQTHTFHERTSDVVYYDDQGDQLPEPTRTETCVGTQSVNISYRSTQPTKMYVFLREAHGLHTLVSDKPEPDSGLDSLSVPGEMTLSRSVSYERTRGCDPEPVDCPVTTFPAPLVVHGNHNRSGGISAIYRSGLDAPPGLDQSCAPRAGPEWGPLSSHAVEPELKEIPGAIPWPQIFGKKKRLSGGDSVELSYETTTDPEFDYQTTVTGTYGESITVELKRLKRGRER